MSSCFFWMKYYFQFVDDKKQNTIFVTMQKLRYLLFPITIVYIIITMFRNWLYKVNVKRSFKFSIPVINIGNLSMGGTGKTPHTEYLIKLLKGTHHLATLSRGYGRKEFGFKIADEKTTSKQIGDEPLQFYKKFGSEITVAVESDRVKGVMDICYQKEEIDLVLLDDAFQHRSIQPGFNILLTDYSHPFYNDYVLPVGDLRELRHGKGRADIIIMTKCPSFENLNRTDIIQKIKPNSNQSVFFSKVIYGDVYEFNTFETVNLTKKNIILVTGIAKPNPLLNYLKKSYNVLEHCKFADHYRFKEKDIDDISNLLIKFAELDPIIITTEKDAMRLIGCEFEVKVKQQPWFYQSITVALDDKGKFDKLILDYVQENRRDY